MDFGYPSYRPKLFSCQKPGGTRHEFFTGGDKRRGIRQYYSRSTHRYRIKKKGAIPKSIITDGAPQGGKSFQNPRAGWGGGGGGGGG